MDDNLAESIDEKTNSKIRNPDLDNSNYFEQMEELEAQVGEIDEEINYLIELIKNASSEGLLNKLFISRTVSEVAISITSRNDSMGIPDQLLKYLVGLILTHGSSQGDDISYKKIANQTVDTAEAINFDQMQSEDNKSNMVEFHSTLSATTTSEFVFAYQYPIAAMRAYGRFNKYINNHYNFYINDAVRFGELAAEYANRTSKHLIESSDKSLDDIYRDEDEITELISNIDSDEGADRKKEGESFKKGAKLTNDIYSDLNNLNHKIWFTLEDLIELADETNSKLDNDKILSCLEKFSASIGDKENLFKNTPATGFKKVGSFNPLSKYPIIYSNRLDAYMLVSTTHYWQCLRERFYYTLTRDSEIGDPSGKTGGKFGQIFGDFVEEWTYDLLSKIFPEEMVISQPKYLDNLNEACDLIVQWNDVLIIIECKASTLSLKTLDGGYAEIKSEISDKAGEAYDQILDILFRIPNNFELEYSETEASGEKVAKLRVDDNNVVDLSEFNHFVPIIVVGDNYDSFGTTQIKNLLDLQGVMPYLIDIYSLQVLTDVLNNSGRFIDYVNQRRSILQKQSILSPDERDYMALYIKEGYDFPVPDELSHENEQVAFLQNGIPIIRNELGGKYSPQVTLGI